MKYIRVLLAFFLFLSFNMFGAEPRRFKVIPEPDAPITYPVCSPYTNVGDLCVWQAGIDIPILSEDGKYSTMTTLVLPPTNPNWDLKSGEFKIRLRFIYGNNCSLGYSLFYASESKYDNNSLCSVGE